MEVSAFCDRTGLLREVELPDLVLLRQHFPRPRVRDVNEAAARALQSSGILEGLAPGARIAVAVGSRGIADLGLIVGAVITTLRTRGLEPFIVPAMGSHGGATAEGQAAVLASLGVTEEAVGAAIISSLDVDLLGALPNGLPAYIDRAAHAADGVILVNRVKPHTEFSAPIESGLAKMLAIGLGKHAGALSIHQWGVDGMSRYIPEVARLVADRTRILGGLAVVENAFDEVAEIVALPSTSIGREPEQMLLERAKLLMARLPWETLDVLVVDAMGKNISGSGLDTNIVGRMRLGTSKPDACTITNIVVLDVTDASHGNALGIGLADFTTQRVMDKADLQATYINALTAGVTSVGLSKVPMVFATDRDAVAAAIRTCGKPRLSDVRLARIQSTLQLEYILASASCLEEFRLGSHVEIVGDARPCAVSNDGDLRPVAAALPQ